MLRTVFRITCVLGLMSLFLWSQPVWSQVSRSSGPVPVSPGGGAAEELTAEACPTFHWGEATEAPGYELIAYRVEGVDATGLEAIHVLGPALGQDLGAPALRQLLPAGVSSWTPSLDRCLEPGGRYAWTVRVAEEGGAGGAAWAEAQHFLVRKRSRLERILGKVVNRLLKEGELSEQDVEQLAAWGLDGSQPSAVAGETPLPPEFVASGAVVRQGAPPARPGLQLLAVEGFTSQGAPFEVDGTGRTVGIYAEAESFAIYGRTTEGTGVFGQSTSDSGRGVYGLVASPSGFTTGVWGQTNSTSGSGVAGIALANSGTTYGVRGLSNSQSGYDFYAFGVGTNYGPFTGGHEARLAEGAGEVVPGMVVSVTGRAEVREANGAINLSSTLPTVTLSSRAADPAVFGVLVAESALSEDHWYQAAEGERFATVNALGEGRVWVTDANGPVQAGDYLTTSDVPGYAQRQGDRYLQSHTLGKAIETVDWDAVTETTSHGGVSYKKALLAVVYTSG